MKADDCLQRTIAAAGWVRRARRKLAEAFIEADQAFIHAIEDLDALTEELRREVVVDQKDINRA
jgi:hypothetical protein